MFIKDTLAPWRHPNRAKFWEIMVPVLPSFLAVLVVGTLMISLCVAQFLDGKYGLSLLWASVWSGGFVLLKPWYNYLTRTRYFRIP